MDEDGDSDVDINDLEELLAANEDEEPPPTSQSTTPASILDKLDDIPLKVPDGRTASKSKTKEEASVVHSGDTDSEDDEEKKYYQNRQYNDYGASIKKMLESKEPSKDSRFEGFKASNSWKKTPKVTPGTLCTPTTEVKKTVVDLNFDKLIGIRITNPTVSSTVLADRLEGRKLVPFSNIQNFTTFGKIKEDWVVFGVIVNKSPPRTSAKGSTYSILKLTDLRGLGDMKTVSIFLFSGACKTHSKNSVGSVIGILNPSTLDNSKSRGDEACLSVDTADRVMVLGTSRDFGICKSKKKNGENCTSFVNKSQCEFCVYHVKQEYKNCSRRSELQSSYTGKGLAGGLNGLRNKVLGKSEVFYGGQSYSAIPAKKSNKLAKQDNTRLSILSGESSAPVKHVAPPKGRLASSVELSDRQTKKDMDRLRKLDELRVSTMTDKSALCNASSQNYAEKLKVEETKYQTLAFISQARESNASKWNVSDSSDPTDDQTSKLPPKTPTQLTRGATFAFAAIQKESSPVLNQASAFGLGRKPVAKSKADVEPTSTKSADKNIESPPSVSKKLEKEECDTPLKMKVDVSTKSPAESKIVSKLIENRITKAMTTKVVVEKEIPAITRASEMGLGRGRIAQTKPVLSKVVPTLSTAVPKLGAGISPQGVIEFDVSPRTVNCSPKIPAKIVDPVSSSPKTTQRAKLKALNYVRAKGSISKEDPNKLELSNKKKSQGDKRPEQKKRKIEEAVEVSGIGRKKIKNLEEEQRKEKMAEFRALMEVTSKHVDLVNKADNEAADEYFDKLERKEKMEEKMLNTYKVACKAVTCTQCKYTAFSAAELCKEQRHVLKVHDAMKRFFKCADCGNRTCCLEIIPLKTCGNCNSSRWERAAMIKERKVGIGAETLSIRGGEEKFIGSVVTGANLNLLVPE